jgi:hypothetical protein
MNKRTPHCWCLAAAANGAVNAHPIPEVLDEDRA